MTTGRRPAAGTPAAPAPRQGSSMNPSAPVSVCAVCAGRPCACDVAVLGAGLRELAQVPFVGGLVIGLVRAFAGRPRVR